MLFLKQSTSQTILIGPFVDSTDGDTEETALTIANTDIRLSKNGGNLAAKNSGGGTHDEAGWYQITLDATDTNTVGTLQIHAHVSGALMVHMECTVLEEAIYDALIGASAAAFDSNQRVDVGAWLGTAVTLGNGAPDVNIASTDDIDLSATQKASVNAEADTALTDYDPPTKAELDSGFSSLNDPTAATIADAVWDEAAADHVAAGSFGQQAGTDIDAILTDTAEIGAAGAGLTEAGGTGDHLSAVPWNAAWDAEVQSEVTDALNAYDPPTKAELDSGLAALNDLSAAEVNAEVVDVVRTDTIPDSYATDGNQPTMAQALLMVAQYLQERSVSGTTVTVKKPDGSTTAMTFTLDDATNPTSITRAT